MHMTILEPTAQMNPASGTLCGAGITETTRRLGDLAGVFADEQARQALPQDRVAYRVLAHMTVPEGKEGGLYFGTSYLEPGLVGEEYFITKGHLHAKLDTGEYYWGLAGEGALILMDEARRCWAERVFPGSLHYIPGKVAHRLANTGNTTLAVGACWLSESGHDYRTITERGFSARLLRVDGQPRLVPA